MPATRPVLFDVEDRVATVTLNRPEAMNALDPETFAALAEAWTEISDNPDIWVAIVTGAGGKAFSAGADLKKTVPRRPGGAGAEIARVFQPRGGSSLDDGIHVWKPIIAAVDGYCLGAGLTLLSVTDFRIASEKSVFGLPEVRRGIFPTLGATHRLYRQLPHAIAMELILYGDNLDAQQALTPPLPPAIRADQPRGSVGRGDAAGARGGGPLHRGRAPDAAGHQGVGRARARAAAGRRDPAGVDAGLRDTPDGRLRRRAEGLRGEARAQVPGSLAAQASKTSTPFATAGAPCTLRVSQKTTRRPPSRVSPIACTVMGSPSITIERNWPATRRSRCGSLSR